MKHEKGDCTITVRVTKTEKEKVNQEAQSNGITVSQYIKEKIRGTSTISKCNNQELAKLICRLYILLSDKGFDNDEEIMEELGRLCHTLLL